jgi:hypothetical protein
MIDARIICHTELLQFNVLNAKVLEQSYTFAEQYRHDGKAQFFSP